MSPEHIKLFAVYEKPYRPLIELLEKDASIRLTSDVTILSLFSQENNQENYAVISLSENASRIIESYCNEELSANDSILYYLLKNRQALHGDPKNVEYLCKENL
ncbi:MAG: hypothetical protein WCR66_12235 [Bacteroidota bacterium]